MENREIIATKEKKDEVGTHIGANEDKKTKIIAKKIVIYNNNYYS